MKLPFANNAWSAGAAQWIYPASSEAPKTEAPKTKVVSCVRPLGNIYGMPLSHCFLKRVDSSGKTISSVTDFVLPISEQFNSVKDSLFPISR